jgi:hypothetical protein
MYNDTVMKSVQCSADAYKSYSLFDLSGGMKGFFKQWYMYVEPKVTVGDNSIAEMQWLYAFGSF